VNSGSENEGLLSNEWNAWLGQHSARMLLFARQQARCEADAQDLVQDAVLESWRRGGGDGPPALGLVYATIRRRAIDLARSQDRRSLREQQTGSQVPICWFDSSVEERERTSMIEQAMRALPATYREVLALKIWSGLTFAEIALALGVPANTAASRYRYGLAELRKLTKEVLA
jgi:RNA polymerase sigma-70 factor (ECF subfamily)